MPESPTSTQSPSYLGSAYERVTRIKSDVYSKVTTGETVTYKERTAATKLQAAQRGKQARAAHGKRNETGWLSFLCGMGCSAPRPANSQPEKKRTPRLESKLMDRTG